MRIVINKNTKDELSLSLFDNGIEINRNLSKFKKQDDTSEDSKEEWSNQSFRVNLDTLNTVNNLYTKESEVVGNKRYFNIKDYINLFKVIFCKKDKGIPNIPTPPSPPRPPVTNVFKMIISSPEELTVMKGKVEKLRLLMEKAKENGQVSLTEKIKATAKITFLEEQLIINNFKKVISEKQMIEFVNGYEKELSLSYIKNYIRHIPDEVIEKKKIADALEIFDNYIILSYDPEDKSSSKTEEEIKEELERKRDPILFGLISGSRKFYFIGDWKDEYCDLTIDKFIDKYSEENITLKEKI